MKTNFKILILTGILLVLGIMTNTVDVQAQVNYSDEIDENILVYWFYVSVREVKDSETGMVSYDLQRKGGRVDHGTQKQYHRALWKNLGNGSKMAIGPFNDYYEAKNAFTIYDQINEPELAPLDSTFDQDIQVFWFILHVNRRPRSDSYELIRKPGAIASGSYADFQSFLKDNLLNRVMTVGPFLYMPEAEEAKRIYRLH